MARGVDEVAAVVASLSRAVGTALDPSSILARAMSALEPVLSVRAVTLWTPGRDGMDLVAGHPSPAAAADQADLHAAEAEVGAVSVSVEGRNHTYGRMVVHPVEGSDLGPDDRALLEIAASQIAGALDRAELFAEVMELERLKSDFIARVSHELRTPITIINGFLETLIAHDASLDAAQRLHMLDRSKAAAARLGHLIEELLILSRIEGGIVTPNPEPLVLDDVFETVRAGASEPDQVVAGGSLDHPVVTDRALLVRALGLLVDNAIKYGGGAELSTRIEPGRWLLEVRDRGPGFADDIRDTAFEMFARSQTTTAVPGLGVGLAIARTLVEVLDGTISLDDASPGPGALVRVSLPA